MIWARGSASLVLALIFSIVLLSAGFFFQIQSKQAQSNQIRNLNGVEAFYLGEIISLGSMVTSLNQVPVTSSSPVTSSLPFSTRTQIPSISKSITVDAVANTVTYCTQVSFPQYPATTICLFQFAPTVNFTVNPTAANFGDTVTLNWNAQNAASCQVTSSAGVPCSTVSSLCQNLSGSNVTSHVLNVSPSVTFTITCPGFTNLPPATAFRTVAVASASPSPSPSPSPAPPPCAGFRYKGGCWYFAVSGQTCYSICASHGGAIPTYLDVNDCTNVYIGTVGWIPTSYTYWQPGILGNNCGCATCGRSCCAKTHSSGGLPDYSMALGTKICNCGS